MFLLFLLLSLILQPAPAALTIFSVNDRGEADLRPGQRVQVVIELRSNTPQHATLQHLAPAGMELIGATASAGALVTQPFVSWKGDVAADQPINIVLTYRVLPDAQAGDRIVGAQAQVAGVLLNASSRLRVCCAVAPQAGQRVYVALLRA